MDQGNSALHDSAVLVTYSSVFKNFQTLHQREKGGGEVTKFFLFLGGDECMRMVSMSNQTKYLC